MKKRSLSFLVSVFLFLVFTLPAQEVDPNFRPDIFSLSGVGKQVLVQPDDKVLLSGSFTHLGDQRVDQRIARLLSDGRVDTTFALDTQIGPNSAILSKAVQTDGKILIGGKLFDQEGNFMSNLLRLETDGSLDTSFHFSGSTDWEVFDMDLLPNGQIAILSFIREGGLEPVIADRVNLLNVNGEPDASFQVRQFDRPENLPKTKAVNGLSAYPDNAVIIYGKPLPVDTMISTIYRLEVDGSIDTTFQPPSNIRTGPDIGGMAYTPAGLIALLRADGVDLLNDAGTVLRNSQFQSTPSVIIADGDSAFVFYYQSLYKISPDTLLSYDVSIPLWQNLSALSRQSDGAIIGVGNFKYLGEVYSPGIFRAELDQEKDEYEIDPVFSPGLHTPASIYDIQVLNSGKVLVGGFFEVVNGQRVNHIARLLPDGKLDTTFNLNLAGEWIIVFEVDTLSNGNYVLANTAAGPNSGGQLHTLDITDERGNVVRQIGSDYPYSYGSGVGTISFLGVDSEDHIYAGESGDFDLIVTEYGRQLAKFDAEGNLVQDFRADHFYRDDGSILYNGLMIQPDDRVLVSGPKLAYDNTIPSTIIRLEKDGALDMTFKSEIPAGYQVLKSTLLKDGSILISGDRPGNIFMYKLKPSGGIDYDFHFGRGVCSQIQRVNTTFLKELEPGRILVCGWCEKITDRRDREYFRMLIDERGIYRSDFLPQLSEAQITALAVEEDGSMYVGGSFELEDVSTQVLIRTLPLPPLSTKSVSREEFLIERLFPNPLNGDRLNIAYHQHLWGKLAAYQLIEPVTGRIVQNGTLTASPATTIPLADLPKGVYLLKTRIDHAFEVLRFVRQ